MAILQVDQDKCSKCGMCSEVCPSSLISIREQGPKISFEKACISCGHCVAICPHDALDNTNTPLAKQVAIENFPALDAKTAAILLRSRRSTRSYKKEAVSRDTLLQLVDIARFAPSGGNTQGVSYIVIENSEVIKRITELTIDWMEQEVQNGVAWAKAYEGIVKVYRKTGKDSILRGAPHLLVATSAKAFPLGRDNSHFALSYVEIYATTLGLATCWAGFVEMCASAGYQPLLDLLNVPAEKTVTGAVMVGYPKYKYKRLADRNPLQLEWL